MGTSCSTGRPPAVRSSRSAPSGDQSEGSRRSRENASAYWEDDVEGSINGRVRSDRRVDGFGIREDGPVQAPRALMTSEEMNRLFNEAMEMARHRRRAMKDEVKRAKQRSKTAAAFANYYANASLHSNSNSTGSNASSTSSVVASRMRRSGAFMDVTHSENSSSLVSPALTLNPDYYATSTHSYPGVWTQQGADERSKNAAVASSMDNDEGQIDRSSSTVLPVPDDSYCCSSGWAALPSDILIKILHAGGPGLAAVASVVCKDWKRAAECPTFDSMWRTFLSLEFRCPLCYNTRTAKKGKHPDASWRQLYRMHAHTLRFHNRFAFETFPSDAFPAIPDDLKYHHVVEDQKWRAIQHRPELTWWAEPSVNDHRPTFTGAKGGTTGAGLIGGNSSGGSGSGSGSGSGGGANGGGGAAGNRRWLRNTSDTSHTAGETSSHAGERGWKLWKGSKRQPSVA